MRKTYERALVSVNELVAQQDGARPTCFVSYAWGDPEHERWVASLVDDLANAGVDVVLDRRVNQIGDDLARFVARVTQVDFVLMVGTSEYLDKYDNENPDRGSVVAVEVDIVNQRLFSREASVRSSVLPILRSGTAETSLPPLFRGKIHGDFTSPWGYFSALFRLVLTLHGIAPGDAAVRDMLDELDRIVHVRQTPGAAPW